MSSVWLCIPSARPPAEAEKVLSKWRAQGYKIALACDTPERCDVYWRAGLCDWFNYPLDGVYKGYAVSVNNLVLEILGPNERGFCDPEAEWFVTGGDDTEPDLNHTAEEIAQQCRQHFYESIRGTYPPHRPQWANDRWCSDLKDGHLLKECDAWALMGVMQPTGDRYANGSIDRIAGSAWYGREYCKRVNGGRGPLWPEYAHMFVDEEAQCVAQKLGVFWQRPDLIHLHHHFMRATSDLNSPAIASLTPPHLIEANTPEHWFKYQRLFNQRKAAGFPGHEPLPATEASPRFVRNEKIDNGDPDFVEVRAH